MKSYTHNIVVFLLFFTVTSGKAQQLFHQDVFYGGVTVGGFSSGVSAAGSTTFELYIETGSTIRKAFLFEYSQGYPPSNGWVSINSENYFHNDFIQLSKNSNALSQVNPVSIHYLDITNQIDPSDILYTVTINLNSGGSDINWGWWCPVIYIEYDNPTLDKISTSLWLNNQDLFGNELYAFENLNPINTLNTVGFSLFIDRACNLLDGTEVTVDGNYIGTIGRADSILNSTISPPCGGTKGHFYYQNNQLFGLNDDVPNNTMNERDAIADVSSYLLNGATNYTLNLKHVNYPNITLGGENINIIFPHAYTTPCDTFSTQVAFNDTTICLGDSIQLGVSGGINYDWTNPNNMNGETTANPVVWPDSTTLYVVRIENEPGCSRTEQVLVRVDELPEITSVSITPSECGEDNGYIGATALGESPFISTIGFGAQNQAQFPDLSAGSYTLSITDQNGCTADTMLVVPEIITVDASFIASPPSGPEPLSVALNNTSQNATDYEWYIDTDFWDANVNSSAYFDSSGVYEVMLIAYNNLPECADTAWLTILVQDTLVVQIPNVFSPNKDNSNDVFTIDIRGAQHIKATILNRWGNEMSYLEQNLTPDLQTLPIWNGLSINLEPANEGVYFYLFEITDVKGEVYSFSGYLHLVR